MNVAGKYKLISFENRNKNGFDLIGRESRFGLRTTIGASFLKALYVLHGTRKLGRRCSHFGLLFTGRVSVRIQTNISYK
jgi:hypothetical protein